MNEANIISAPGFFDADKKDIGPLPLSTSSTLSNSNIVSTKAPLGAQWDVTELDDYFHSLLLTKFLSSLDPLLEIWNGHDYHRKQNALRTLRIVLSATLAAATIWTTQAQTPATKAVGLRTVVRQNNSGGRNYMPNSKWTKWNYIFWVAVTPLLYKLLQRWKVHLEQQLQGTEEDDNDENDEEEDDEEAERIRIAQLRQYQLVRGIVELVDKALPVLKLGLLLTMVVKPKSYWGMSPPRLAMALTGLQMVGNTGSHLSNAPTSSTNPASVTTTSNANPNDIVPHVPPRLYVLYAHRRWLYEESIQTIKIMFAPLASSFHEWRQLVHSTLQTLVSAPMRHLVRAMRQTNQHKNNDNDDNNAEISIADKACSLCGAHPVTIPYETDVCSHIFCYICLWKATTSAGQFRRQRHSSMLEAPSTSTHDGSGYPCPACHRIIRSSRPLQLHRY